jgi:hypothetical protein
MRSQSPLRPFFSQRRRCEDAEVQESEMSRKKESSGIKDLQGDLEELTEHYHEEPEGLSHRHIARTIGRIFVMECYFHYGLKGYQMAGTGIKAILDTLEEVKPS